MAISVQRTKFIMVLGVIAAWVAIMLLIGGCTAGKGLRVDYVDQDGKNVIVSTDYQIENGFTMERNAEGYKIDLGSATTKENEAGLYMLIMQMMTMMREAYMGVPPEAEQ